MVRCLPHSSVIFYVSGGGCPNANLNIACPYDTRGRALDWPGLVIMAFVGRSVP